MITNSDEFTVMLTAATDYNIDIMNFDRDIKPLDICKKTIDKVSTLDYESVKAEHIARHRKIMNRVQFDITSEKSDTIPTDKRLKNLKEKKDDKHLTELFFQYGRYLLLSSSGGDSVLPANLQGIWNKEMWAEWESDFHLNINLQMNYWPADITNLSETVQPLTVFMKNLAESGQVTASEFIDTEGWMAVHATNAFGRTTPSGSTKLLQVNNGYCFPLGGAWMSLTLWRHFEFNQDKTYLKNEAYPIISGAARFILDFLVENEKGELVTVPSYSPENNYIDPKSGKSLRNTVASTLDIQIIRDVFHACLASEKILNQETELTARITDALQKLPETKIGENGTIQEWYEDYEEVDPGHRHISHLYALYPSNQITANTPELFEAARKTVERRLSEGGGQTGWSRAWIINFYARLFEGDESYKHISELLKTKIAPNLFNLHNPKIFQIDGNLGVTAGVAEMLLQSHEENIIRVLPALPTAWKDGYVTGLKARGGLTLNIYWSNHQLDKVIIKSDFNKKIDLIYDDSKVRINLDKGVDYVFKPDKKTK